jgi:hypothetical protein
MTSYYNTLDNGPHSENDSDEAARSVREAFAALPFEKKISTLLRVELDMFGDAIDAVVSAASKAADQIADALSGTGSGGEQTSSGGQASNL